MSTDLRARTTAAMGAARLAVTARRTIVTLGTRRRRCVAFANPRFLGHGGYREQLDAQQTCDGDRHQDS